MSSREDAESNSKVAGPLDDLNLQTMVGFLLRRCRQRALDLYAQEIGHLNLRPRHFVVLLTIHQNAGINQTDLVRLTGIDRSTAADMITRLARRDLIRRERTDSDQRANVLHVTEHGLDVLNEAVPGMARAQERLLEVLPPELRQSFIDSLMLLAGPPEE